MAKTIVVCGYGPGVSDAVARKFGSEGFSVATGPDFSQESIASKNNAEHWKF